ncbi:P-loop containing nucleoside triphosphate hydrolase protein, partial [Sordaria brevicollis]
LQSKLQPWQASGVVRLCRLAHSPFRGALLCDEMGLGKSLTALVAAIKLKRDLPGSGYVLVITRKSCVLQWLDEIRKHFAIDHQPSVLILDTGVYPAYDLLSFDIVICSQSQVRHQYIKHTTQQAMDNLRIINAGDRTSKHPLPILYSPLYSLLGRNIRVVIFDEAHDARNETTLLAAAVRALEYDHIFLLTGTPVYNHWDDLLSLFLLFPCPLFDNKSHFIRTMGGGMADRLVRPDDTHLAILSRLLLRLTVARPKSVLDLPEKEEHTIKVVFDADPEARTDISQAVKKAQQCLRLARRPNHQLRRAQLVQQGFRHLTLARQIDSNRLLTESLLEDNEENNAAQSQSVPLRDHGQPASPTVGPSHHLRRRPVINYKEEFEDDDEAADPEYEQEDINPEFGCDLDLDGEEDDDDNEEVVETTWASGTSPTTQTRGRSDHEYTIKWLNKLRNAEHNAIFSPKVRVIVETVLKIFETEDQNEQCRHKIMITATSVKFLDIIHEAIRRVSNLGNTYTHNDVAVVEYNGTMPILQRDAVLRTFNQPLCVSKDYSILLISSTCGGIGINVTGASDLIICEPYWAPGLRDQIIGRIWRMGQERSVRIWDILTDSAIDDLIISRTKSKTEVKAKLLKNVVRKDGQRIMMPRL